MTTQTLFKQYIWLVNTIWRAGRISLSELNRKWLETDMSEGVEMARTTFNRHKNSIEDIFGLFIECDRKNGYRYYIGNPEVLEDDSVESWMLSTLSLGNIISDSLSLHDRIVTERISVDENILASLIKAMRTGHRVNIRYRQYGSPQSFWTAVDPYALKLFHQKWYLLGRLYGKKLEMFCLSKMEDVDMQQHTFKLPADFHAADFFEPYFGVIIDESIPTQRIVIRAYGDERFELMDVRLHRSQILLRMDNENDYADFEVTLKPTTDFLEFVLSKAGRLKVLSPQPVAETLKARMQKAINIYNASTTE